MENEFSKPKVLIDLEEYEWLKEDESIILELNEVTQELLKFIYSIKNYLGLATLNLEDNKIKYEFYESLGLENDKVKELVEEFITNQLIIEKELNKQKENK